MSDLYRRLKAAKERSEEPDKRSTSTRPEGAGSSYAPDAGNLDRRPPEGFGLEGGVYVRRELVPLNSVGSEELLLRADAPVHTPPRLSGSPKIAGASVPLLGTHIFFDLEATGLSTGAGTVAFLLGLGRRTDGGFELTQWLLPDYPYEPELLSAVAEELQALEERLGVLTLVSYNGRSFDTPLLRTRMLMNGIPFEPPRELDLLPISRRFWRRTLEDCSLGTVEAGVLSVERGIDVPGAFVPLRYFDYLRSGRPEPLLEVVAHHRQDILSLYLLLSHIELLLQGEPLGRGDTPAAQRGDVDSFELAKLLIEQEPLPGAAARGEAMLRELTLQGSEERAALYYGRRLRRRGENKAAYEVWNRAFRGSGSAAAAVMAAKVLEHEFRDFDAALTLVEALLAVPEMSARLRKALLHRQERLRRRSASS